VTDGPLPGQFPRLRFSPRRAARHSGSGNSGFGRLLSAGGAAALAMGGAAAVAALVGGGPRKDHGKDGSGVMQKPTDPFTARMRMDRPFLVMTADHV
jgi:hypothetical protein